MEKFGLIMNQDNKLNLSFSSFFSPHKLKYHENILFQSYQNTQP